MADPLPTSSPAQATRPADNVAPRRPSLLPAFEPFSSSPIAAARPTSSLKRKFDDVEHSRVSYPTPIPTSETGILPSSPPRGTRPGLQRAVSTLSERAPLGDVPTLDLPANGEPVLMGRSSNSSDYQLSANRHISRVHVRASYHLSDPDYPSGKVEVECLGWNGCRVHCRGEIVELAKGKCFVCEKVGTQIMVDVQDTRVMLVWPKEESREASVMPAGSRSPWNVESPSKRRIVSAPMQFASSPPAMLPPRPRSPISPTPAVSALGATFASTFHGSQDAVPIYEDHNSDDDAPADPTPELAAARSPSQSFAPPLTTSRASEDNEEFSEHDEENDPIVHSFGPFGDNILGRMQSFQHKSPDQKRRALKRPSVSPLRSIPEKTALINTSPVKNHVINQLAFSRIHSLPLSTIHSNLPAELRNAASSKDPSADSKELSQTDLKTLLDAIPCVGEISREGKDAAGKLLESEFYYVPEMDVDVNRKETVTMSLGKTSIRAARKSHKQYYWKKPRH